MWDAMDLIGRDHKRATKLCQEALSLYPDCVDALTMLADLESETKEAYVEAMAQAIEAGRRDLGSGYFKNERGMFWGLIETRPFMRAMAQYANSLIECGKLIQIDEAILIAEEMLELNPNDNQGMRDILGACYLQRKRYDDATRLLKEYENDWMAIPCWTRVLLAHARDDEEQAVKLLDIAREQNPFVELYLTAQKRRPKTRPGHYSPGDDSEAVYCADTLWEAWKKHPKSKRWLKDVCSSD
jgi:tetratricopeptide (TPR) repeat protein